MPTGLKSTAICVLAAICGSLAGYTQDLAIESVHVVNTETGEAPVATVLVASGRIDWIGEPREASIPSDMVRIDGKGKWLVPGLIEFHSHDTGELALRRALSLGITTAHTIVDPSVSLELLQRSADSESLTPRLLFTSGLFGEFPEHVQPGAYKVKAPRSTVEARRDVDELHLRGASAIKIWQDDGELWFGEETTFPPIPADVYRGIVAASHENRLRVYAHAWKKVFAQLAIESGVDSLIHPVIDARLSDADFEEMARRDIAWATTMAVVLVYGDPQQYAQRILADPALKARLTSDERSRFEADAKSADHMFHQVMPELALSRLAYLENIRANTLRGRDLGVTLALGSDEIVGIGTHIEAELMQEIGLSPLEVLHAATRGSATALGLDEVIGTVAAGYLADLLVLGSDPRDDVRSLRDIAWVIKGGRATTPSELFQRPTEVGPLAVVSLREALQNFCEALNEGDVDSIHKHYLSEVTRFHDSGKLDVGWSEQHAEAFADYVNDGFGFALEKCHVVDARVYGDIGITAGYMYGHMTYPGGTVIEGPWRFTYLWVRQDGEWKEAHHHVSLLKAGGD